MSEEFSIQKDRLIKSFIRLKQMVSAFHVDTGTECAKAGVSMAELEVMREIKHNALDSDKNTCISDIQNLLCISKAGVSKKLNILEEKGYIARDIDRNNRRQLIITLTERGKEILRDAEENTDKLLTNIITKLGKEQTAQFIELLDKVVDATNDTLELE